MINKLHKKLYKAEHFYQVAGAVRVLLSFLVLLVAGCDLAATVPFQQATATPAALPTSAITASAVPSVSSTVTEDAGSQPTQPTTVQSPVLPTETLQITQGSNIKTVFVIVMENHNWADIKDSSSAPYINNVLLPSASYAEQYYSPPGIHPSEPNYLWLEVGTSFGISNDRDPSSNHQATANHLVTLLSKAGIAWKSYQEGITGKTCPLVGSGLYAPKHNPMVYFDDVTDGGIAASASCIAHERPYSELAGDLQNNTVARYNFITPDLCHDMHNPIGCRPSNSIKNGDNWLAAEVPRITASVPYKQGGVLFITWDEGEGKSDGPIGMIVLSQYARGAGYSNTTHYTHRSTLRTVQEIFGVTPLLGDAAKATDLSDLFKTFP